MIWAIVVAMMAVGMVLLVAEVAIIPGFGVAGVSAAVLLVAGAATAWTYYGAKWGVGSLLVSAAATAAILTVAPRTRAGKALVLDTTVTGRSDDAMARVREGQEGTALTALRPAGAAELAGRRVDVVTDGRFIESGKRIKVASVEGARVVVVEA